MMDVNIGSSHGAFCLMRSLGTPPVFGRPFPSLESFSSPLKKKKNIKSFHTGTALFSPKQVAGKRKNIHHPAFFFSFLFFGSFCIFKFRPTFRQKGLSTFILFFLFPPSLALSIYIQSLNPSYRYPGLARKRIPKGKNPLCSIGSSPAGDSSAAKKKKKKRKEEQQQQ